MTSISGKHSVASVKYVRDNNPPNEKALNFLDPLILLPSGDLVQSASIKSHLSDPPDPDLLINRRQRLSGEDIMYCYRSVGWCLVYQQGGKKQVGRVI